jgi:hypothetical protein
MAVTTLTTTAGEDSRMQAAAGIDLALGRNATGPETRTWVIKLVRDRVRQIESNAQQTAALAAVVPLADINPT